MKLPALRFDKSNEPERVSKAAAEAPVLMLLLHFTNLKLNDKEGFKSPKHVSETGRVSTKAATQINVFQKLNRNLAQRLFRFRLIFQEK